ncbi:hypothetical protein CYY_000006 [Polysphondylium violaceum]|uniref:Uncharacterized protein n=1 Tax=Polysphondylium violaceum TaxID=133409 RepID=A0A8J4Q3I9_9MYCE|nr:hypothetical protein CYY_000006 [Polysphondylium violaceum]
MSKKDKSFGGGTLQFTKVVPKFLQNLKKTTEVDINEKFKDYMNQEDNDEITQDQLEKEAIERALKEEQQLESVGQEKEKLEQEEKEKQLQEQKQEILRQDAIEEEKARLEGRERKIVFQKPSSLSITKQPNAAKNSKDSLNDTIKSIKKTNSKSPKSIEKSNSAKKKQTGGSSMLSFDIDE